MNDLPKREWDAEMMALATEALIRKREEDRALAKMTKEEWDEYVKEWAQKVAAYICHPDALGGP